MNIWDNLSGLSKDAFVYLIIGLIGGFAGQVIRSINEKKSNPNARHWFLLLVEIFIWTILGGMFALVLDLHPLLSLIAGLGAPTLYNWTQNTTLLKSIFLPSFKGIGRFLKLAVQASTETPTPTQTEQKEEKTDD